MVKLLEVQNPPFAQTIAEGWRWINGEDTIPYVANEMVVLTSKEAKAYETASNELYEMYIQAAEHIIEAKRYHELDIPLGLIPIIEYSWEHDQAWHLYGRFDLSGGIGNDPIKLLEFNADTATCIPETAIIQLASLTANNLEDSFQFNDLFDSLKQAFVELKEKHPNLESSILFSTIEGYPEDQSNVDVLAQAAKEAGFEVGIEHLHLVDFSEDEGIFKHDLSTGLFTQYSFWFKLLPWEQLALEEPELLQIIEKIILTDKCIVLNPAYTLLFQSKGILKVLWDLFPNHPLLLETKFEPLKGKSYVEKVMFGREGSNVRIVRESGGTIDFTTGNYGSQKKVYQQYTELDKDAKGNSYQAGVFVSGVACGLGFRRGGLILDNKAQFCGHIIEN